MGSFDYSTPFAPMQSPAPRPDPISSALDTIIEKQRQERTIQAQRDLEQQRYAHEMEKQGALRQSVMDVEQFKVTEQNKAKAEQEEERRWASAQKQLATAWAKGVRGQAFKQLAGTLGYPMEEQGGPADAPPPVSAPPAGVPSASPPPAPDFPPELPSAEGPVSSVGQAPLQPQAPKALSPQLPSSAPPSFVGPKQNDVETPAGSGVYVAMGPGGKRTVTDFGAAEKEERQRAAEVQAMYRQSVEAIDASPNIDPVTARNIKSAMAAVAAMPGVEPKEYAKRVDATFATITSGEVGRGRNEVQRVGFTINLNKDQENKEKEGERTGRAATRAADKLLGIDDLYTKQAAINNMRGQIKNIQGPNSNLDKSQVIFNAIKAAAGKGVLSDQDVRKANGIWSTVGEFEQWLAKTATGDVSADYLASLQNLADSIQANVRTNAIAALRATKTRELNPNSAAFSARNAPEVYLNKYNADAQHFGLTEEDIGGPPLPSAGELRQKEKRGPVPGLIPEPKAKVATPVPQTPARAKLNDDIDKYSSEISRSKFSGGQ